MWVGQLCACRLFEARQIAAWRTPTSFLDRREALEGSACRAQRPPRPCRFGTAGWVRRCPKPAFGHTRPMAERVFLSGPMGSGKSALAARLSELWRVPSVDLDQQVEERAGRTIPAIFAGQGETAFRALEASVLREVLGDPSARIVSLGGGTVLDRTSRRALLQAGTLVTLRASVETLAQRVGDGQGRPLLSGPDVHRKLSDLLQERASAYAECHAELDTDAADLDTLAQALDRIVSDAPVVVPLGERTYRVEVGAGVRHGLLARVEASGPGRHVVVVTDDGVEEPWGQQTRVVLQGAGLTVTAVCLAQGEANKTLRSVESIWDAALDAGADRDTLVLAVGGGVVGDMAAFAASTLLRGVSLGQLPTTLLAMVDSAVGGKTGIDRPQGKNLVGSFHQPRFVLCDVETLSTLPLAERRAGLAEVVKSAWLSGDAAVAKLEKDADTLLAGDLETTSDAVRMSVQLKANIVSEDEHEAGARALLNLGHTVGHAIEAASDYRALRHGEAVALGMVAAFRVSRGLRVASAEQAQRMSRLLGRLGLPTDLEGRLDDRTLAYMGSDKKRKDGRVRFIVPGAPGQTQVASLELGEIGRLVRA